MHGGRTNARYGSKADASTCGAEPEAPMSATAPKRRDQLPECFQLEGHSGDPKVLTPARTRPDLMSLTRSDNSLADVETKLTSFGDSTTEQSAFVAPPERYVGTYRHSRRKGT